MAMVFLSENPDQIYSSWNNGPNNGVKITALPVIDNGKRFEAIVIFSGCVADESGNCNVVADWSVNTVTGKSLGEIKNAPLWVDRPAPVQGQLQISEKGLGLVADKKDVGYVFTVKVKDLIGGKSVQLIQRTKVGNT